MSKTKSQGQGRTDIARGPRSFDLRQANPNLARHYLISRIAAIGGMDIHQMMGFSMGWFTPSDDRSTPSPKRMSLT